MAKPKSKYRKIFRALFYLAFLLVVQEIALRILFPLPEIKNFDRINYVQLNGAQAKYARNENRYWESLPDTEAIFVHEMNRYGFRDQEWKIEKEAGKKRVLFVGDSFVEGIMAGQEQTIPAGFEAAAGEKGYEVFNAGMVGQGLGAYLQLVADMAPVYQPDLVFLCIYANDLGQQPPQVPAFYLEPTYFNPWQARFYTLMQESREHGPLLPIWDTQPRAYLPAVPNSSNPWTDNETALAPQVDEKLAEMMKAGTFNPYRTNALRKEEKFLKQTPKLGETIPFLKYTCDQIQSRPVVVYIPSRNQVTRHYYQFENQFCRTACPDSLDLTTAAYQLHPSVLAQQCQQFGLQFIDLTADIKAEEDRGNHLYWNYDEHMKGGSYLWLGKRIWERMNASR